MKNVEDIYPLSPMQQGLLFHALYSPEIGMYMEQKVATLQGEVDSSALCRAWQAVVDRHPVLRTAFLWQGLEEPLQVVRKQVRIPWREEDWRDAPADEQAHRLEAYLAEDRAQGMALNKAPLMRLALFRLAADRYQLVWSHHHISLDGWSLPLVFKEIFTLYEAYRRGQQIQLPRSRPYRDYIAWLQKQDLAQAESFWQREMAGVTAPTPLGIGRHGNGVNGTGREETYRTAEHPLSTETSAAIQEMAQQHGLTVNTLAQGAWGLLLSHYSAAEDVVFGATVSGRPPQLPGVESIVGLFINSLPVRVHVCPEQALLPWLKDLQARQVAMRDYEYTPLVKIQEWSRQRGDQPLFESLLVFENYPVGEALRGQEMSVRIADLWVRERANFPIIIRVAARARITLETLYSPERFDAETNDRLLAHLALLLEAMIRNPDARLGDLKKHIDREERRQQTMRKRERKSVNLSSFMAVTPSAVGMAPEELVTKSYLNDVQYPLVIQPNLPDVDLVDWASGAKEFIERELLKHGAILFRGFGVGSIATFENFARGICGELYGEYGDLPQEKGKIYKSTPYPEDKTILFHNESSHWHSWPMKQFFYCVKAAREGGETPIVDCRKIYQRLDPKIVENFEQRGLMYVRNFVEGLDVSWQTFFRTDDKAKVEDYCRQNGIECEWRENDGLRTRRVSLGVARHPKTGEMSFFNQVQLHHSYFLEPELRASLAALFDEEDYPRNVYYGDGAPIEDSVMEEILNTYWETCVQSPWQEGDVIMLDNMISAHARNPYKGERKITVALGEMIGVEEVKA